MNGFLTQRTRGMLAAVALVMSLAPAGAGEINDIDGPAINGYDPVAYFTEKKPVVGSPVYTAVHKGATFRFSSAANRDAFVASPDRFTPQYGGFCAYGASRGYKAKIDPAAWTIVDDKLYLNYSLTAQATWTQDKPGYIAKADKSWPEVSKHDKVNR